MTPWGQKYMTELDYEDLSAAQRQTMDLEEFLEIIETQSLPTPSTALPRAAHSDRDLCKYTANLKRQSAVNLCRR